MFRFIELSLHGWDLWQPLRLPLNRDVVLVSGPNGSGKTTLLDAIRQLLNAPRLSSRRRLQHYLRRPDRPALLRAIVSNDGPNGTAPFRHERIVTPEATLACALVPAGGGAPEKRFAILPGRVPIEKIQGILLDSREWYPPEQYARALERSGVTRSLMGVLAIEQGRTNSLSELKPRDLFQRVLEMLGDHQVLERYRTARRLYEDTQKELSHQMGRLSTLQVELQRVLRQVLQLDAWESARDKMKELEAKLPAAELQTILRRREEEAAKIPGLRTRVRNGETEATRLKEKYDEAGEQEKLAQEKLDTAQCSEELAREVWGTAREELGRLVERVRQLEEMEHEAAELPIADLQTLERQADEASQEEFAARSVLRQAEAALLDVERKIERLRAGLPVYPDAVTETLAALAAAEIEAVLLADKVDIVESHLAAAVESSLGDARYALLVHPEGEDKALAIACRFAFPGPVYTGPRTMESETVGPLALDPGAPAWLRNWIKTVQLTSDGTWRDDRGVWVARVQEALLGAAGRQTTLARAEQQHAEERDAIVQARSEAAAARERKQTAEAALTRERRRQDLLAQLKDLPMVREQARARKVSLHEAEEELKEATANRQRATQLKAITSKALAEAETVLVELKKRLEGEREALQRADAEVSQCDEQIKSQIGSIRPDLYLRACRGELDGPDTVRDDLRRARDEFTGLGEPPPEEVRQEAQHLQGNIEEAEAHVLARRGEAEQAQAELDECRRRYLEVVEGALQDYRRRAMELAERAAILVEMDLPRLEDNDRVLDEAAIDVRFGFDGKEALPLGDPSFSGGQQVIAGLILLMAMAETEGRGFYMLDEPFAHLSLDRVDDVGQFLRSTRSQFILTAPTTLDRAQLDPASLVIVLHKKRPDEPYAPVPTVAVA